MWVTIGVVAVFALALAAILYRALTGDDDADVFGGDKVPTYAATELDPYYFEHGIAPINRMNGYRTLDD